MVNLGPGAKFIASHSLLPLLLILSLLMLNKSGRKLDWITNLLLEVESATYLAIIGGFTYVITTTKIKSGRRVDRSLKTRALALCAHRIISLYQSVSDLAW
jgi:hypothetical protein